jgi:hypothetical protein
MDKIYWPYLVDTQEILQWEDETAYLLQRSKSPKGSYSCSYRDCKNTKQIAQEFHSSINLIESM